MDPLEELGRREEEEEQARVRAAQRRYGEVMSVVVIVAFVGVMGFVAWEVLPGAIRSPWLCGGAIAVAIPIAILRALVRRGVNKLM
ncbi:hypothetical protein [Sandaracinus amylolyticus]|uniref:Uncharacterized protein n=1 Tax=Sandaracinus amylolyticus TaxID=927083 RepID=A0A0F6SHY6_9BACT|nr:hypothetical protein [Sandaracinus amylolyticus]AKF11259.1 hypothetical protein DB32_008408 [Sandaracinus amylolyticus]